MIKIKDLNKIYKSKKRKSCHALKDINLTFGDSGLVFVLGKSGSGKSTLLNLIGGLDSVSSGSIEVNGNDLSSFGERAFSDYRNTHVGFIFQDYHLIEELTVYENIMLSLDLRRIEDDDKVKRALERVDLAGYEDRYPAELSGGEQQRVAIARAIVKNPRIILADEPTGNLDTKTARSIIELLRELSRECLILIVSHNVNDAKQYADRIIELSYGNVISDKIKNPEFLDNVTLKDGSIFYSEGSPLEDHDIEIINSNREAELVKCEDKYIPTPEIKDSGKNVKIEKMSLSFKNRLKLSGSFLKNKVAAIVLSSFMVAVIMVIMALAQTIIAFDSNEIIQSEMNSGNQTSILLNKVLDPEIAERLDGSYRAEIDSGDIQAFYDAGYEGKIYPVLNISLPITEKKNALGWKKSYFGNSIYIKESLGTLMVDESFFLEKFGKVEYLAKLDEHYPEGIIITDYLADSILAINDNYEGESYEKILGDYNMKGYTYDSIKVNAIIYTGYREKNAAIIEKMNSGAFKKAKDYYEDPDFLALSAEIYSILGYSFSTNPDFMSVAYLSRNFLSFGDAKFHGATGDASSILPYMSFLPGDEYPPLAKDVKVVMSLEYYNKLFGTEYDKSNLKSFVPHKVVFTRFRYGDDTPLYTVELTVDKLMQTNNIFVIEQGAYPEIEELMRKSDVYYNSLYFDGLDGIGVVFENAEAMNYEPQSFALEGIYTMTRAVEVFVPIFELIAVILCIGVVFILVSFSMKAINDKMHEIGIMKALGTKNGSVSVIFGIQVLLIALLTCALATLGYLVFIDLANTVLIESLRRIVPSKIVIDLNFLTFKPDIAGINCVAVLILSALALIVPMVKIYLIEPVKIIKAND